MNKLKEEWIKFYSEHMVEDCWNWINQNYISKEEVLRFIEKRKESYEDEVCNECSQHLKQQIIDYKYK